MRRGSKKGGDEVQASVHEKMVVLQLHPLTPAHAIYISISASKQSLTIPTLTRNNLVFFSNLDVRHHTPETDVCTTWGTSPLHTSDSARHYHIICIAYPNFSLGRAY